MASEDQISAAFLATSDGLVSLKCVLASTEMFSYQVQFLPLLSYLCPTIYDLKSRMIIKNDFLCVNAPWVKSKLLTKFSNSSEHYLRDLQISDIGTSETDTFIEVINIVMY